MIISTQFPFCENTRCTRSIMKYLSKIMQKLGEFTSVTFWTKVDASIVLSRPRNKQKRKWSFCNFDIHITIVCFQQRVVNWFMFFYKIVFQVQCLTFCGDKHKIKLNSFFKHFLLPDRSRRKVLFYTIFQIFCFSNIQNIIFYSVEKIHSCFIWNCRKILQNKSHNLCICF